MTDETAVVLDLADVVAEEGHQEHKTVRSGAVYDFDKCERRRENTARAAKLKEELGNEPAVGIENRLAYRFVKRSFDIVFSAAVLVLFCWLFAIIAIAIKIDDSKGPVIFKQERVGKDGKTFQMYKFRSMYADAHERPENYLNDEQLAQWQREQKVDTDPRITKVGRFIRKTSLACVIIGTPGDGESTKPLSYATKTSLDQQFSERRPEFASRVWAHYTSPKFLSLGFFDGFTESLFGAAIRGNCSFNTWSLFGAPSMLATPATTKAVSA